MDPQNRYLADVLLRVLDVLDRPALLEIAYAFGLVQQMPGGLGADDMRVFLYGQLLHVSKEQLRKVALHAVRA